MNSPVEQREGWFASLDQRLKSAVLAIADHVAPVDDGLRGLYISDEQALALATELGAESQEPYLAAAVERLGLDPVDAAVLAVCVAPELHPRYGRLYAYLQDDVTRRLPSPRLTAALLDDAGVPQDEVLERFAPDAELVRLGAIRLLAADPSVALLDRPVKVTDRLVAFMLGGDQGLLEIAAPQALRRIRPWSEGDAPGAGDGRGAAIEEVRRALRAQTGLPLVVSGPDAASIVATAAGRSVVLVDLPELEHPETILDATLASVLEGGLLCFDGLEDLEPSQRTGLVKRLSARRQRGILIASRQAETRALGNQTALIIEVPFPSFPERRLVWERLTGTPDASSTASKFRLSVQQIETAAEVAKMAAKANGADVPGVAELDLGARHVSSSGLADLAVRHRPRFGWDELVLPERQRDLLKSISAHLRHRERVLTEWGYERTVAGNGLKVLFAGESGTGKTMAAEVLAAELGLDLFRVDLATVVSKYIGETEKNLERIFTAADGSNAILFFDEADAVFGKRSQVSDAHDRYANIEVAYLLQRMEAYPGVVILATNYKHNVDDAFIRRLEFVVDFPLPDAEDRERLWRVLLPPEAPLAEDADIGFLASQFKLSGGGIRNCSMAAAFQAAEDGELIHMRHLVRAVAQEYAKQGRLTLEADFDRFHHLVRPSIDGGI